MNPAFSLYLDLVRFAAAGLVYMSHSNLRWLSAEVLPAATYAHTAVVVFFVLSGFVIAYITDTRERDWVSYSSSRMSRVMSVVLPALVLTLVLDSVGRQLAPGIYYYPYDQFFARIAGSLLMANEAWLISITYFSNVPYWSIGYEFWYYVIFGTLAFVPGRRRWWLVACVFAALGPKLLLLAPVWYCGVFLYRWQRLREMSQTTAWLLFGLSVGAIVAFHAADLSNHFASVLQRAVGKKLFTELTFSNFFVGDYLLGPLVMLNFAGARRILEPLKAIPKALDRSVRTVASFTFSLYLLHQPLLLFWGAVLRWDPKSPAFWWAVTALTAVSVVVIAQFTENRRYWLRKQIERGLLALRDAHRTGSLVARR